MILKKAVSERWCKDGSTCMFQNKVDLKKMCYIKCKLTTKSYSSDLIIEILDLEEMF